MLPALGGLIASEGRRTRAYVLFRAEAEADHDLARAARSRGRVNARGGSPWGAPSAELIWRRERREPRRRLRT